jgi:predicted DNA-binding transcriptional regulator AlpA
MAEQESLVYRPEELAKVLGISKVSVHRMNSAGRLPKPVRLGRCVAWQKATIAAWLDADCPNREKWEAIKSATKSKASRG